MRLSLLKQWEGTLLFEFNCTSDSLFINLVVQVVEGFKSNEEKLKKYVEDYKEKLKKSVIYTLLCTLTYLPH